MLEQEQVIDNIFSVRSEDLRFHNLLSLTECALYIETFE